MKNFYKKHRGSSIFILILVVAGGYYWYNKTHQATVAVQYKTAVAEKGSLTTSVSGSGNVIVDQSVNIDPTITGTVTSLAVNIGDQVKKGQVLFSIVNDQLGINAASAYTSLIQARQSLESAKASLKQTEYDQNHNRAGGLATTNILKNKLEASEISLDAANQNVIVANAKYQSALSDKAKMNVLAPSNGTVNAINIKNGDDLSKLSSGSSRTVPMIIGDLGTIKTQVQVNEVDVPNVSIGQKVMMTFSAIDGLTMTGKIEKMDALGTITQGVVTYNVTIGFDSLDPRIKPQMSVSAKIITGVKQDVITVPNSALKTQGNATYLEVLKDVKTPERRTIEIGSANNTETEIVSGVKVGDNVVVQTIDPNVKATTPNTTGGTRIPGFGGGGR